ARRRAVLARALALPLQLVLEAGDVDGIAALRRHQLRQVEREAEGVVEAEDLLPGDRTRPAEGSDLVEALHPLVDGREEALLLRSRGAQQVRAAARQLRVHLRHLLD